jgi:demethylmenaquinone methyltransferase/2-methoxy-6-polyprenyl-1,4-benzoquinol methylase
MFADIADRYDTTNTVLSLGIHHLWRRRTVRESGVERGDRVLDCATGTGDLALEFKRAVGTEGHVVGTDFCPEMLAHAPLKSRKAGLMVQWEVADAMELPYEDDRFDVASIAFGIRNVDDPAKALASMARVVKPGGRVVVLEFGQPGGAFGSVYQWYSNNVLPVIGGMLTGEKEAYSYLNRTSSAFPCGEQFVDLMRGAARFEDVRAISMTGGVCWLYLGVVS